MNTSKDVKALTVLITFLKLGLTSFGGPIAHIGYFRKEFVERKGWLNDSQFNQLLTICQFLPGPASSQMGFAIGLLKSGWLGAINAFIAFTLPSVLLLIVFATLLPALDSNVAQAAISGLKIVAFVVVADAIIGMSKKLCTTTTTRLIAIFSTSIVLLSGTAMSQIVSIIIAAGIGGFYFRQEDKTNHSQLTVTYRKSTALLLFSLFVILLIVFISISLDSVLYSIADVFYRAGALVFGGGHVVLPLLETAIINEHQWLSQDVFLTGYGASQAIPGPMFAFSAYIGMFVPAEGYNFLAVLIAVIFMFLPGFLLVAAALPFWQTITTRPIIQGSIIGVNAAVVGILGAALYDPIFISGIPNSKELVIGLVGFGLLNQLKLSPLILVIWCVTTSSLLALF